MSRYRKVVWNEGMLLTPHHFQQWDNYFEGLLNSRVDAVKQYDYGVLELQVSNEAIANGNFQLINCRAVMPDGLFVNVPDAEAVPDMRPVGDHFRVEQEKLGVHLAIPAKRPAEQIFRQTVQNRARHSAFCRKERWSRTNDRLRRAADSLC